MAGNTTKRFSARYGRKPKAKLAQVEALQKAKQKCPYCHKPSAKRLAMGIFHCSKCNTKFTGKAYTVQ